MIIEVRLSNFLDLVRWIAAFLVVINHTRALIFPSFDLIEHRSIFLQIFYFITGFGHQAVIIFFVLSGFLIGGNLIKRVQQGQFSLGRYIIDRLSRLYIVLIVVLFLGLFLDRIGLTYFNDARLYTETQWTGVMDEPPASRINLEVFLGNVFMLQTIAVPTFGSNGPLWSLAYEFWYYLLFPLIVLTVTTQKYKRILYFGLLVGVVFFLPGEILKYFVIWLFGASLAFLRRPIFSKPLLLLIATGLTLGAIRFGYLPGFRGDLLLGIIFSLAINSIQYAAPAKPKSHVRHFNQLFASFSYSVYAIHFPILIFLISILSSFTQLKSDQNPTTGLYIVTIFIICAIYIISYLLSRVTEGNTHHLRAFLYKHILRIVPQKDPVQR